MNETGLRRTLPDHFTGSGQTFNTPHHPSVTDTILSKRVCFYKSGDPQFNGLRMVINNRTFKTFDALLDNLSKKVPLPFGVRNITTPRGVHGIHTLDDLEDGKSYICSDSHKVKPINLALARKKLPPWYHTRPVSSRRQVVQLAKFFPGQRIHRQESVVMRIPRKLVVFRNGNPSVKHTVVLHKKTTPNYESILDYISELMQFHVVKLYTPDGRRVDGLSSLILSSGTVVAVGREPFRSTTYGAQKSPAPTRQHTKATGFRRKKALNRKNKPLSYVPKSRNFSASSERYIVHQINNTIAGSSCNLPSHPTNSFELDSNRLLESVAETEGETCLGNGAEGRDCSLPSEDNIEKSFRVNQDGSMTVEMKVRLTIKEEETVHWTTTLTRSSAVDQPNAASLPESEAEKEACASKSNSGGVKSPTSSFDSIKDQTRDNNDDDDDDAPSLGNEAFCDSDHEEDEIKRHTGAASTPRAPTPGYKKFRKQQASVESITSVTADGIKEGTKGSYSYSQHTESGTVTEQYCLVKQSTTRPVPKPRTFSSVDANKSVGRTEMLQKQSSDEEFTETVLHIYEQQTCQENFHANVSAHTMSVTGVTIGRPATSETGQLSLDQDSGLQLIRPSTASESVSIWRAESKSITADTYLPSLRNGEIQNLKKCQDSLQRKKVSKSTRVSLKPKLIRKRVRRVVTPGKRAKERETTNPHKKAKTFSSAGFIKRIYGPKSKSTKMIKKQRKIPTQEKKTDFVVKNSPVSDHIAETVVHVSNMPLVSKEKPRGRVSPTELSSSCKVLTKQTSMHMEENSKKESQDLSEGISLTALNSSSSATKEYVESWLEKAHLNSSSFVEEAHTKIETVTFAQEEHGKCGGSEKKHVIIAAERAQVVDETSEMQTYHTSKQKPESPVPMSVKLRIQSLESKLSPTVEKTAASQQSPHSSTTTSYMDRSKSLSQKKAQLMPLSNGICSETILPEISQEMPSGGEVENSTEVSFDETHADILSMELPPPPPELLNSEYFSQDVSSVGSSPLYRLSPISSQRLGNHTPSMSPRSDNTRKADDKTMEEAESAQRDVPSTQQGAALSSTPTMQKAPLISHLSLESETNPKQACLDKCTIADEATAEKTSLSASINPVSEEVLSRGSNLTGAQGLIQVPQEDTQQSVLGLTCTPSLCTSASPVSLTSDERMSSASISSSEASLKETKIMKGQKEAPSPKTSDKRAKAKSSPSPERKYQIKKSSSQLQSNSPKLPSLQSRPQDKSALPNISIQKHVTPNPSPSTERKHHKLKLQHISSPYSQSLDMVSPPVKHKSGRKLLTRNLSLDNPSEPTSKKQKKAPLQTKGHRTLASVRSPPELGRTLTCETLAPPEADQSNKNKVLTADQDKPASEMHLTPPHFSAANQPSMKPVLEKICYSIKSIRQITQSKRRSCLEKSNSLPDFSSHVASTFGSSSKALLAFLAVMTLKEGLTNLNVDELNANNVSCAEALKMIDSLREIATIEDSLKLQTSLMNLQQSTSKRLLESWKDFQDLSERCTSRNSTPKASKPELQTAAEHQCGIEGNVIDEIMHSLDIPEKLKEELASLSDGSEKESDNKEGFSVRITKSMEQSANQHGDEMTKNFPREDVVSQDVTANTDVRSIIKKFTDVTQSEQPEIANLKVNVEAAQQQEAGLTTKDKNSQDRLDLGTKYPPADPDSKQIPENRHLCNTLFDLQSCRDVVQQEHQEAETQQQGYKDAILTHKSEKISSNKSPINENFNTKKQDVEFRQLQMQSEESIFKNESTHDEAAEEKGQMSSANTDLNEKESCNQSSEASEGHSSDEEEADVACEEIKPDSSSEDEEMSSSKSESEEDDDKQSGSSYVDVNVRGKNSVSSPVRENQKQLEKHPQIECRVLRSQTSMRQNVSADERAEKPNQPSSEEEQPVPVPSKKLQVIVEESFSGNEEEKEDESLHKLPKFEEQTKKGRELEALIEDPAEDQINSDEEVHNKPKSQSSLYSSLIISDSLEKAFRSNANDDSGNDHSCFEEHVDEEHLQAEDKQINSSIEEELSYYEKESSSEEDPDPYYKKSCMQYQEVPVTTQPERVVLQFKQQSEGIKTQSVAERVILLEKQVADAQKATQQSFRSFSQRKPTLESDEDDTPSESPTSEGVLCTRSAPQSSLSFSYDSSGVITTEPEGSRVRSIREMFMAKSATDIQQRRFPSSHSSEQSELHAETSGSGGYQSQTSSELSSGEDDSARKSITKGFVRRTIERLYGKKDTSSEEPKERTPSEPNPSRKEHSSIFSPFHAVRSKAMSEMSYFNSSNALDILSGATRCIAFNAQVAPGDSVPIDNGRWLLKDNTLIRKSVSDPIGINKTFTNSTQDERLHKDSEDNLPHSHFSAKSEQEDKVEPLPRKCTYFSLPHASESEVIQDDLSTISKSSEKGDSVTELMDDSGDTKTWAERNGMFPIGAVDFKIKDNKVHPLIELPPDREVVVVQPGKGQAIVNRRLQEPDVLDLLYNFCGEHCPIL